MCSVMRACLKHLGVRVKEPHSLESSEVQINILPKVEKSIEKETEGEERAKNPRLPSILGRAGQGGKQTSRIQRDGDQGLEHEHDPSNWQQLVGREVLASLHPDEIKRQDVIHELFYTERAHVQKLGVLDQVFHQRLSKEAILPPSDIESIFSNLDEIHHFHVLIVEQMVASWKMNESSVIDQIGDDVLAWFSSGDEKIKQVVGTFCRNRPSALEIVKPNAEERFKVLFLYPGGRKQRCHWLQLKDLIPVEMQRFTKYPLLLDVIAKYTDNTVDKDKVKQAANCCREILNHVNQALKESEDKQRLERRLDPSALEKDNPMFLELKNLDLTKRTIVHEGLLSWKLYKNKTIEVYSLLLEDILVLMQRQDGLLILTCHSKKPAGTNHILSPIIRLNTILVRPVATDSKSFFIFSMSEDRERVYKLMAPTVADQRMWQGLLNERVDALRVKPYTIS
ncbi:rho guanine nucleotide exchange factor 12 isoform X4 [Solea senegalensis]|uniref:Rho guanine nucleotide exchange factor 12 isoform X4 n=2 Tax=Solea senegalensis TaxID=28829 RepID=A0AAV6QH68_SOLSE|nr:rho guanine nucleotide exchange factor 12 isoform X4 [Solea senegalensis]